MKKVASLMQYIRTVFLAATVFAMLIFPYPVADAKALNTLQTKILPQVPKNLDEALKLSFLGWQQDEASFKLDAHNNGDRSLLLNTNTFTTPDYGWGVALAHPDLCSYDAESFWLANLVYVVRGNVVEVSRVPFGGTAEKQSITQTYDSVIVRIDATFDKDDCQNSQITATVIER